MSYITNLPTNGNFNVTAYYGQVNTALWKNGHKGIDITGDKTLYSLCSGVVTVSTYDAKGWGQYVSIKPDGFDRIRIILCHMVKGSQKVRVGDKVTRKSALGTMGATGNVTGVHVHVEMRIDNTPVNPAPYLGIENLKASGLVDKNYATDEASADAVLKAIQDNFDGISNTKPATDYKELYEAEHAHVVSLESEIKGVRNENTSLVAKITAIKNILN